MAVHDVDGGGLTATVTATADGGPDAVFAVGGDTTLALAGAGTLDGRTIQRYESPSLSAPAVGLPATVSGATIAALTGGRLPIGLTAADSAADLTATWTDSWRVTVTRDADSGVVLDAATHLVRSLQVVNSTGVGVSVGTVADVTTVATEDAAGARRAAAVDATSAAQRAETWKQVVPTLLGVAALVLVAGGLRLRTRRAVTTAPPPARRPETVSTP